MGKGFCCHDYMGDIWFTWLEKFKQNVIWSMWKSCDEFKVLDWLNVRIFFECVCSYANHITVDNKGHI